MNKPDKFIVIKINQSNGEECYKVFASWIGGYLDGDSWKMNSGIVDVEIEDKKINFIGYSGSIYQCYKDSYGTTGYSQGVLNGIIKKAEDGGHKIKVMPEDTDWEELFKESEK